MKYPCDYIQTHDIDWFFLLHNDEQEIPIHIASRGYDLPDFVNDIQANRKIQHLVSLLDVDYDDSTLPTDIEINEVAVAQITELVKTSIGEYNLDGIEYNPQIFRNDYLKSFAYMAHVGFYSFDTFPEMEVEGTFVKQSYRLIAKPKKGGLLKQDVLALLPTDLDFSIELLISVFKSNPSDRILLNLE